MQLKLVDYKIINNLKTKYFILDKLEIIYKSESIYYTVFKILKHHFVPVIKKQKILIYGLFLAKYQKWFILLRKI